MPALALLRFWREGIAVGLALALAVTWGLYRHQRGMREALEMQVEAREMLTARWVDACAQQSRAAELAAHQRDVYMQTLQERLDEEPLPVREYRALVSERVVTAQECREAVGQLVGYLQE